jgi:Mg2+ and Co2+ transporter CorA
MPNGVVEKRPPLEPNASTKPHLLKLVEKIQQQVTEIQNYLTETSQPDPSFIGTQPPTKWTDAIDDTRSETLHNIIELQELLMTPKELLHTQSVTTHPSTPRYPCPKF